MSATVTNTIGSGVSSFSCTAVSVATSGNTEVATVDLRAFPQRTWLWLSVNTDSTAVLDAFLINAKVLYSETSYAGYLSGTDFDTATGSMAFCSTTGPHELGASATALCRVYVGGLEAIQIQASTSTLGSVTIYGTLSN